jgi:alkylation response protein AidB-like acyl-CoA dehydrogenase
VEVNLAPPRDELVKRAAELVPLLQANALWQEEHRRLHPESVEAMIEAGIFRMRVPVRFGGYETDARTMAEVAMHLGRGDASIAFTVALWWITSWLIGLFPDEVQDEIFAKRDVRACGTLAPTGTATKRDGGIVVSGRWGFNTGADYSDWKILSALLPAPDGGMEPIMAIAPLADLEIVDDWYVSALRGTGSVTAVAGELFIPARRYVPIAPLLQQRYFSKVNADRPIYRAPMIPAVSAATIGKLLGIAMGAQEAFMERLPGRAISFTGYTSQREAPVTHARVAEAALLIDETRLHCERLVTMVDEKGQANEAWTMEERGYARMAVSRACQLAKSAVDVLAMASGASSIYDSVRIQRIQRDVQAVTLHALNLPDTNLELYGRILCGLEPNSPYI